MAINVFIKFEGPEVAGSSTSKGHESEIEVMSWNHGFHQPASPVRSSSGGGTIEKAHHSNFSFTKMIDAATSTLLKHCWTGAHFEKVSLTCYRSSGDESGDQMGVPYLKIEMDSVIVGDYSVSGGPGDLPVESVSLNYAKVTYTYTEQDHQAGGPGGAHPVSHDLSTNVVA